MDLIENQPIPDRDRAPVRVRALAEQNDLALAWFAASLAGIAAISLVPDRLGAMRMLSPLVAMAAFVMFGLSRSRFSTPRLADSIYFMGFLWTLWALIDVLVFSEQLRAQELYKAFGYALIATASGMFVRLSLLQFYRSIDDQEDQAVDQMDQAVARLQTCVETLAQELARTQRAVAGLRTDGAKMLDDWHTEFAAAARKPVTVLADAANSLDQETKHLAGAVKEVRAELSPITRTIKALETRLADGSKKLSEGMTQSGSMLEESLGQFRTNLSKIETTPGALEKEIRAVAASLQAALAPLNEASSKILKDVDAAIIGLAKSILTLPDDSRLQEVRAQLTRELEGLCTRTRTLTDVVAATSTGFRNAGDNAAAVAGALDSARKEIGRGVIDVTGEAKQLGSAIDEAKRGTRDVDAALHEVITFVRDEVARL